MKWLARVVSGKKRTPVPPRPYKDMANPGKAISDTRTAGSAADLAKLVDPEKPHWKDPRFESRSKIPYFDIFGFNRDWSWSWFKVMGLSFFVVFFQEMRIYVGLGTDCVRTAGSGAISPAPEYSRNERATEKELREAGFAYVGVQELDNIGALAEERRRALEG